MDLEEARSRAEEMSRRFGIAVPQVEEGATPPGAHVLLGVRDGVMCLVIGPGYGDLPPIEREAAFAWVMAQAGPRRPGSGIGLREVLATMAAVVPLGLLVGAAERYFEVSLPLSYPFVGVAGFVALLAASIRKHTFATDRRVAEVCGRATLRAALDRIKHEPPPVRGVYRLVAALTPSPDTRAARLG
ncbi:hypothetical protein [Spongiactinospora sp. TRM90649]|uniref:hypothetical protein n=1 Tax=Spongiactinospora sp. TRM90649 TaxID=3031114 RepID=UPI0023F92F3E|nr:hypothetical protein [Spongiactinospora sp. TRM90649]MDF5757564.1 hypothetical protein [Spongiactinospora sp. TRM90649]